MKVQIAGLVIAIAAMAPAYAGQNDVEKLAAYTDIPVRKVQMILGVRTAFAEYTYTYYRYNKKFQEALGKDNYDRLMSGQPIRLDNGEEVQVRVASVDQR